MRRGISLIPLHQVTIWGNLSKFECLELANLKALVYLKRAVRAGLKAVDTYSALV